MIKICNKIIEYSFYALFLSIPLAISSKTSELFEFNKMWLAYGITIVIAAAWLVKMILQRKIVIQKTPLDIPILLFLASQVIATFISWDIHVSFWGYYSRFNGGLLSTITYIFLYYSFVSNLLETGAKILKRVIYVSLITGAIVALWGLPSHFGYDPTCLLFRGTLDVSCWTADFMPKIRIFSTLGQPDWLAAYLLILLPLPIASIILMKIKNPLIRLIPFFLLILFYIDLLFTQARSGIIAIWISLAFFTASYVYINRNRIFKTFPIRETILLFIFISITFFIGTPIPQLAKFTFKAMKTEFEKSKIEQLQKIHEKTKEQPQKTAYSGEMGGTDSSKIRLIVWKGAINIWKEYPIFGTGVETFAFAYYKYKLPSQNLTSEWNFLYNKAHNEYLNYLATTGIFGLGSYLLMIGWFLFLSVRQIYKFQSNNYTLDAKRYTLIIALVAGYISILITNFFGFSVVITNIYLFMIPTFVFVLLGNINPQNSYIPIGKSGSTKNPLSNNVEKVSWIGWILIPIIIIAAFYFIFILLRFWNADKNYAYGYNLDRTGDYVSAYPYLAKAIEQRNEPIFKDEFSINNATLAVALINQKNQEGADAKNTIQKASAYAQEAIAINDQLIDKYPNNTVYWKTRVRIFYTLSQADPGKFLPQALTAIQKAAELAPNDASISYNLGILYGQNNDVTKGIHVLQKTLMLKSDYQDAHYALGLFYRQMAINEKGAVIDEGYEKKAVDQMQFIIDNFPNSSSAKDSLKIWGIK